MAAWGWSVLMASLSSSVPRVAVMFRETRTSVSPAAISPRQIVRDELLDGKAAAGVRVGKRQEVGLVDEVGLDRPGRRDVQLAAADHGDAEADGPAPSAEAEALALGGEPAVRRADRLLEADDEAGRLVVVVLALDRVGDEARRLLEPPGAPAPGHDEVEAPLGPGRRPDRRLDDGDGVRGVLEAVGLGDNAELHLQSDGHRLTGRWRAGRRDADRPYARAAVAPPASGRADHTPGHHHPQPIGPDPAGGGGERLEELVGPDPQLLADDRGS